MVKVFYWVDKTASGDCCAIPNAFSINTYIETQNFVDPGLAKPKSQLNLEFQNRDMIAKHRYDRTSITQTLGLIFQTYPIPMVSLTYGFTKPRV